jgi:hypothetical protein
MHNRKKLTTSIMGNFFGAVRDRNKLFSLRKRGRLGYRNWLCNAVGRGGGRDGQDYKFKGNISMLRGKKNQRLLFYC